MTPRPPASTLFPYTTLFRSSTPSAISATMLRALASRPCAAMRTSAARRSEEHTSELQSRRDLVCRLLLEKKKRVVSGIELRDPKAAHDCLLVRHRGDPVRAI